MRTFITIFVSLIFIFNNAQTNQEVLKAHKNSAEKYESEHKYFEALNHYYNILNIDNFGYYSENANAKIELLLPICRKAIIDKLKGAWILKQRFDYDYNSNLKFTDYMKVENNQLYFYNKSNEIILEINLNDNPFIYSEIAGFPSLKIDKEIWSISIRELKSEKRLRWRKHIDYNGNLVGKIDERGIIIDKNKRRIALQEEIDTYYEKID